MPGSKLFFNRIARWLSQISDRLHQQFENDKTEREPKMENLMCPPQSAVQETQRQWAEKLKHIRLEDLKTVSTFSCGGLSNVKLVQLNGHPDSSFALKIVPKAMVRDPIRRKNMLSEKEILTTVRSDFIVRLYRTFEDRQCLYLLTEYLPGGELFKLAPVSEDAAKFYVACVVEALDCLHSENIAHNDLKPENVVLGADGYAKLIDFGFAERLGWGARGYSVCGTCAYMAPELAREAIKIKTRCSDADFSGRDRAVDLWALGIVAHDIVAGRYPFLAGDDVTTCKNILKGFRTVDVKRFPPNRFSEDAEAFVRDLCVDEPQLRLGYDNINDIRKHRWFKDFNWAKLQNRTMIPPIVPRVCDAVDLQNFKVRMTDFDIVDKEEQNWNF